LNLPLVKELVVEQVSHLDRSLDPAVPSELDPDVALLGSLLDENFVYWVNFKTNLTDLCFYIHEESWIFPEINTFEIKDILEKNKVRRLDLSQLLLSFFGV